MTDQSRKNEALKAQRAEDGRKAMAEYEAAAVATREKTERLRALRLAREAEEARLAPPAAVRAPRKAGSKAVAKPGKAKAASLSSWLKDRKDSGHSS